MTPSLRRQMFMFCAGMLYFGAMLAGLGGYGWSVVPVYAGLFLMWIVILRPDIRDARRFGLGRRRPTPRRLARVALRTATQVVLVVFCFILGRGVGGVTGHLPHVPLGLALGLSFLALPLVRLLQSGPDRTRSTAGAQEA